MKFPEGWEVEVVRPDGGQAYAEISQGSEAYVVGIPEQAFEIRVTVPFHLFLCKQAPNMRIVLTLDGVKQLTKHRVSASSPSATFRGFVNTVRGEHFTSQFLFGKAQSDPASVTAKTSGNGSIGSVAVRIEDVRKVQGELGPTSIVTAKMARRFKTAEGKKWYMQPSLLAKAGRTTGPPVTFSRENWMAVKRLAVLNLRMETVATLTLRKVLHPGNPVHLAIIQSSETPDEQEQHIGASAAVAGSLFSNATVVNAHPRGLKRVKIEQPQVRPIKWQLFPVAKLQHSAQQPEVIDLT